MPLESDLYGSRTGYWSFYNSSANGGAKQQLQVPGGARS